jgi:hypothetical protein
MYTPEPTLPCRLWTTASFAGACVSLDAASEPSIACFFERPARAAIPDAVLVDAAACAPPATLSRRAGEKVALRDRNQ